MMVILAILIAILSLVLVLLPFFYGPGGALASASAETSTESLVRIKEAIVRRYLTELEAFEKKHIPQRSWEARKRFLQNRYIDTARRLDFLRNTSQTNKESSP